MGGTVSSFGGRGEAWGSPALGDPGPARRRRPPSGRSRPVGALCGFSAGGAEVERGPETRRGVSEKLPSGPPWEARPL